MADFEIETHPFEPFIPEGAKILMLGTFPPKPEKWSMEFYYPNKINDMWRIVGLIFFDNPLYFWDNSNRSFKLQEIKNFLTENKIALYDTGREVIRHKDNASDKHLEIVKPIDLFNMLDNSPDITSVVTTGEKATSVIASITGNEIPKTGAFTSFDYKGRKIKHFRMPSSSRAYPLSLEKKAEAYAGMFRDTGYSIFKKNA